MDYHNGYNTSHHPGGFESPFYPDEMEDSQPGSAGPQLRRPKKTVGFGQGDDTVDTRNRPLSTVRNSMVDIDLQVHSRQPSFNERATDSKSHLPDLDPDVADELRRVLSNSTPQPEQQPFRPRPVLRRGESSLTAPGPSTGFSSDGLQTPQETYALQAYERGKLLERHQQARSNPESRRPSPSRKQRPGQDEQDIPLQKLYPAVDTDSEGEGIQMVKRAPTLHQMEAERLVHAHSKRRKQKAYFTPPAQYRSGANTPEAYEDEAAQPVKVRGGILGMLLSMQEGSPKSPSQSRRSSFLSSGQTTQVDSPESSGTTTPTAKSKKAWYSNSKNASTSSLAQLVGSSSMGVAPVSGLGVQVAQRMKEKKAAEEAALKKRKSSVTALSALGGKLTSSKPAKHFRITVHIAETIARQRYLEKLCRALMEYGAPTHRLEEYMKMSARVLEIEAQFLYIPGSMIISFDDSQTHTAAVRLVRVTQGLDLGKLRDVHELYKEVVHDRIGVEEATVRLSAITKRRAKFNKWLLILVYGVASASVGPFAFGARLIDLPIAFVLGALVGLLQLHFAPRSELYSNVFEISAAVLTSFLARAFGSINGGQTFCFSALAQSSIALILPGYTVLCASLELQSRSIVAGSVRMVYAIIYSLFLGFGIMIGTAIYGRIDSNATSATKCTNSISAPWIFIAVPIFTLCLIVINQGKWKQVPVMMIIAFSGYLVNFYSSQHFAANTQIANTLGAFAIGVMANLYSRVGKRCENWCLDVYEDRLLPLFDRVTSRAVDGQRKKSDDDQAVEAGEAGIAEKHGKRAGHKRKERATGYGLAAAAMLPAIFVQVPSGLAVSGSLVSGLTTANAINSNTTSAAASSATGEDVIGLNSVAFNVSYSVVQVAIGITVGLFLAAVVVYPGGKRRSGLFSF